MIVNRTLSLSLFHTSDSTLSAFKSVFSQQHANRARQSGKIYSCVYVCIFTFSLKGGISIYKYIPLVCKIQLNEFETYKCKKEKGQTEAC